MKILVVGSGGREHAITWRLAQDAAGHELFCAPGNAGTAACATNLAMGAEDIAGIVAWAEANRPDLVVVGPEAPLVKGLVDALQAVGITAFGPVAAGARMEGSKRFAKEIMDAAGVPTGKAETFTDAAAAKASLPSYGLPVVIKADGLAAGKGVVVAETAAQAEAAIDDMLVGNKFGAAGAEVLIEEFLHGEECSILALVDGNDAVLLPSSQDHKRVFDGDKGPNTGGMGAYSPAPVVTADKLPLIKEKIIMPVVRELARRGARLVQYDRGALVHGCDGQCLGMIRVQTGRLRACMLSDDGREITLYRLTDGDACVLAAACVIRQITFEVQLVADAPTELLILGAHVFQQLTAENIHVECCMYRLATERFSDVMWAMQQLLFTSFDKRLAQYLWDESDHARAPVRATHEQIARDTGAVRETVTRMLRHFADDGIVSLGRGTVTVTDAEKLRKLAGM